MHRRGEAHEGKADEDPGEKKREKNQDLVAEEVEHLLAAVKHISHVEGKCFCQSVAKGNAQGETKGETTAPARKMR